MSITRKAVTSLTLDLSMPDVQTGFGCTLGDRARRLEILVTDGGKPFAIPPTWSAFLSGVKPDQTELVNGCVVEGGRLTYDFESGEQIATCAGRYAVTVWIMDEEGTPVASPKIWVNVIDSGVQTIMNNNSSEDQFGVLQEIVGNINALIDKDKEIDATIGGLKEKDAQVDGEISGLKENTRMAFEGVNRELADVNSAIAQVENDVKNIENTVTVGSFTVLGSNLKTDSDYVVSFPEIDKGDSLFIYPLSDDAKRLARKYRISVNTSLKNDNGKYSVLMRKHTMESSPFDSIQFGFVRLNDNSILIPSVSFIGVDYTDLEAISIDLSRLDDGEVVETFSDGTTKTTTIEYDADGNPVKITDGDGNVTVLTW